MSALLALLLLFTPQAQPDRWRVLQLPALAEASDLLGRAPGAALWPERFNEAALARIRTVMTRKDGAYSFEALYQQNPTPREGAFFKASQFEIVKALPASLRFCRGWDLAGTKNGKRTAGVKIGKSSEGVFYVAHVTKGQWLPDDRDREIRQTAALDGTGCAIHLPRDPGQAGIDQGQKFVRMLAGYNVKVEPVTGSKETRADSFAAQVNAGNVKLLEGSWNSDFIEELRQFPQGAFSDQVDAAADAFNELALGGEFEQDEWVR